MHVCAFALRSVFKSHLYDFSWLPVSFTSPSQMHVTYLMMISWHSVTAPKQVFISVQASSPVVALPNGDKLWQTLITLTFMFSHWHSPSRDARLFQHYKRERAFSRAVTELSRDIELIRKARTGSGSHQIQWPLSVFCVFHLAWCGDDVWLVWHCD